MPVETELYDILGVNPNASADEIKKAFRKLAQTQHPDKGGDPEKFKKINSAYDILSNPQKKELYDMRGKSGLANSGDIPEDIIANIFGNIFSNGDFGKMFNIFHQQNVAKASPILHQINVSLEDLCKRKIVKLKVPRDRVCQSCSERAKDCDKCKGRGFTMTLRSVGFAMIQQTQKCDNCQGLGKVCPSCEKCNQGSQIDFKIFDVHLTPHMDNGYRYIFQNDGNHKLSQLPGDFIVVITIKEHENFKLNGKNLIYVKQLSLKEALCGHSFEIPHPSGEILNIVNNDVITPYTLQTIPKGMVENSVMEIHYRIIFPEKLTPETKTLLQNNL
jgi:DnaJ family protein A protein 2